MKNNLLEGRILFAIALVAFGIEFFTFGNLSALMAIPGTTPFVGYALGILLIGSGIGISSTNLRKPAGFVAALIFFGVALAIHVPHLLLTAKDAGAWTVVTELVALGSGALILSGSFTRASQVIFAGTLIMFGILHFIYANFIAGLIPDWIPGRVFLAYLVGVGFLAAAISIISSKLVRLSTTLLGVMFLTWVVILHAPRVASNVHTETEWTSLFIALAMAGISLGIAERQGKSWL